MYFSSFLRSKYIPSTHGATSDIDTHCSVCVRAVASANNVKLDINSRKTRKSFLWAITISLSNVPGISTTFDTVRYWQFHLVIIACGILILQYCSFSATGTLVRLHFVISATLAIADRVHFSTSLGMSSSSEQCSSDKFKFISCASSSDTKYDSNPGITNSPKADKLFDALSVINLTMDGGA